MILNRILPYGVKNFFIFDGEKLDEFFTKDNILFKIISGYSISTISLFISIKALNK
jgi:hypothetical protein